MKHVRLTTRRTPVRAFTINWKCIPCILVSRELGLDEEAVDEKCSEKVGEPCVT